MTDKTTVYTNTPRTSVESLEEMWAVIKFRLLAMGSDERIEAEIERMVSGWRAHIDRSEESTTEFRAKLYALVREGMVEDREAYFGKRKH